MLLVPVPVLEFEKRKIEITFSSEDEEAGGDSARKDLHGRIKVS